MKTETKDKGFQNLNIKNLNIKNLKINKILIYTTITALLIGLISLTIFETNNYSSYVNCKTLKNKINTIQLEKPAIDCQSNFDYFFDHNSQYKKSVEIVDLFNNNNKNKLSSSISNIAILNQYSNRTQDQLKYDNFIDATIREQQLTEILAKEIETVSNQYKELITLKSIKFKDSQSTETNTTYIASLENKTAIELLLEARNITNTLDRINKELQENRNNTQSLTLKEYVHIKKSIKYYESKDFLELSDSVTTTNEKKPNYTLYSTLADKRIYDIAFKRGYKYRTEVNPNDLSEISERGIKVKANEYLQEMIKAAKTDGYSFALVSGYRNPTTQSSLFKDRLAAECLKTLRRQCNNIDIESGGADNAINQLLTTTSVPYTSKHHTGLTIDVNETGIELTQFKLTKSYQWLSQDNYYNAKRFGFIPSYPSGGTNMGPDPEPWEFIFVGKDKTLKN